MGKSANNEDWAKWNEKETNQYRAIIDPVKNILEMWKYAPSRSLGEARSAHDDGERKLALQLADEIAREIDYYKGT